MKKVRKKYAIDYYLQRLSRKNEAIALNYIPQKLGITERTLHLWKSYPIGDKRSIPADALMQLAEFFEVEPKDLYTEELEKIRPGYMEEVKKSEDIQHLL